MYVQNKTKNAHETYMPRGKYVCLKKWLYNIQMKKFSDTFKLI
jgi:hypothetical protein